MRPQELFIDVTSGRFLDGVSTISTNKPNIYSNEKKSVLINVLEVRNNKVNKYIPKLNSGFKARIGTASLKLADGANPTTFPPLLITAQATVVTESPRQLTAVGVIDTKPVTTAVFEATVNGLSLVTANIGLKISQAGTTTQAEFSVEIDRVRPVTAQFGIALDNEIATTAVFECTLNNQTVTTALIGSQIQTTVTRLVQASAISAGAVTFDYIDEIVTQVPVRPIDGIENSYNWEYLNIQSRVLSLAPSLNSPVAATFTATVTGGEVTTISIVGGGSGYPDETYNLTFSGGSPTVTASATAVASGGVITSITITSGGVGYGSSPSVTLFTPAKKVVGLTPTNQTADFGTRKRFSWVYGLSEGNTPVVTVNFSGPDNTATPPTTTRPAAQITFISGNTWEVELLSEGYGYTNAPTVSHDSAICSTSKLSVVTAVNTTVATLSQQSFIWQLDATQSATIRDGGLAPDYTSIIGRAVPPQFYGLGPASSTDENLSKSLQDSVTRNGFNGNPAITQKNVNFIKTRSGESYLASPSIISSLANQTSLFAFQRNYGNNTRFSCGEIKTAGITQNYKVNTFYRGGAFQYELDASTSELPGGGYWQPSIEFKDYGNSYENTNNLSQKIVALRPLIQNATLSTSLFPQTATILTTPTANYLNTIFSISPTVATRIGTAGIESFVYGPGYGFIDNGRANIQTKLYKTVVTQTAVTDGIIVTVTIGSVRSVFFNTGGTPAGYMDGVYSAQVQPPPTGGVTAEIDLVIANGRGSVLIKNPGFGYTSVPVITAPAPNMVGNGHISGVRLANNPVGYISGVTYTTTITTSPKDGGTAVVEFRFEDEFLDYDSGPIYENQRYAPKYSIEAVGEAGAEQYAVSLYYYAPDGSVVTAYRAIAKTIAEADRIKREIPNAKPATYIEEFLNAPRVDPVIEGFLQSLGPVDESERLSTQSYYGVATTLDALAKRTSSLAGLQATRFGQSTGVVSYVTGYYHPSIGQSFVRTFNLEKFLSITEPTDSLPTTRKPIVPNPYSTIYANDLQTWTVSPAIGIGYYPIKVFGPGGGTIKWSAFAKIGVRRIYIEIKNPGFGYTSKPAITAEGPSGAFVLSGIQRLISNNVPSGYEDGKEYPLAISANPNGETAELSFKIVNAKRIVNRFRRQVQAQVNIERLSDDFFGQVSLDPQYTESNEFRILNSFIEQQNVYDVNNNLIGSFTEKNAPFPDYSTLVESSASGQRAGLNEKLFQTALYGKIYELMGVDPNAPGFDISQIPFNSFSYRVETIYNEKLLLLYIKNPGSNYSSAPALTIPAPDSLTGFGGVKAVKVKPAKQGTYKPKTQYKIIFSESPSPGGTAQGYFKMNFESEVVYAAARGDLSPLNAYAFAPRRSANPLYPYDPDRVSGYGVPWQYDSSGLDRGVLLAEAKGVAKALPYDIIITNPGYGYVTPPTAIGEVGETIEGGIIVGLSLDNVPSGYKTGVTYSLEIGEPNLPGGEQAIAEFSFKRQQVYIGALDTSVRAAYQGSPFEVNRQSIRIDPSSPVVFGKASDPGFIGDLAVDDAVINDAWLKYKKEIVERNQILSEQRLRAADGTTGSVRLRPGYGNINNYTTFKANYIKQRQGQVGFNYRIINSGSGYTSTPVITVPGPDYTDFGKIERLRPKVQSQGYILNKPYNWVASPSPVSGGTAYGTFVVYSDNGNTKPYITYQGFGYATAPSITVDPPELLPGYVVRANLSTTTFSGYAPGDYQCDVTTAPIAGNTAKVLCNIDENNNAFFVIHDVGRGYVTAPQITLPTPPNSVISSIIVTCAGSYYDPEDFGFVIDDETGFGCELGEPVLEHGGLLALPVLDKGYNYTNPSIRFFNPRPDPPTVLSRNQALVELNITTASANAILTTANQRDVILEVYETDGTNEQVVVQGTMNLAKRVLS